MSTSFSVDWFAPGEYARKRLSFPKSARMSIDDFISDTSLSFSFNQGGEVVQRPAACCWTNSAPAPVSDPRGTPRPAHPRTCEKSVTDWRASASPGVLAVADDGALRGLDFDVSCLDSLDEKLLLAPMESFSELCWAAAVDDDDDEPAMPDMHSFFAQRTLRPFAKDLTLQCNALSPTFSSFSSESHYYSPTSVVSETPLPSPRVWYADADERARGSPARSHATVMEAQRGTRAVFRLVRATSTPEFASVA